MKICVDKENSIFIDSVIHKYCRINQNLYSSLINNSLWFSKATDFNDPFDCNLNYDLTDINFELVHNHLSKSNKIFHWDKSDDHIKNRAIDICKNPQEMESLLNELGKKTVENKRLTCFSESDSTLLMWSHYAESHKGICLTFDINHDKDFFNYPLKVNYPSNYPIISPFVSGSSDLQAILATKSKEWEYEKEIRIIKDIESLPNFQGTIDFNTKALIEIKFGYKTPEEQILTIKNLISVKYPHVKLYRSKIPKKKFSIDFYPLN